MRLLIAAAALALSGQVFAQEMGGARDEAPADTTTDATDVWLAVEAQWNAAQEQDKKWADEMLTSNFVGWGKNSPAPRNKESTKLWDRFNAQQGKTLEHELYPQSIVVDGDVAIAHYFYTSAFEDKNGDVELTNGRYTDVLVRTDDGWKFLAWHGGDDGE